MKELEALYKAYKEYKKLCVLDEKTERFYDAYKASNQKENEDVIHIFSICKIEEDWVEAIEKGLPYLEKAIKEERQFIRNDGEIIPIEKIRKVSKDSIQDLSKHANYITHEAPEDSPSEVMPDKLLMIRKESDYAIYENRVLYAALVYLKEFVTSRLTTIKETTNTYIVNHRVNKLINMGNRKIEYKMELNEKRSNDPILSSKNSEKDIIDRLDVVLTQIMALLKTSLMREVSKVEMVSRPIQKTNILKMNTNFRESLACFEYIASYQGPGFTIKNIEKSYYPIKKEMSESYSESLILLSFLDYMYTNELSGELEKEYQENKRLEELKKEEEILYKLKNFKAAADEKEMTMNEYFILFEKGYQILEKRNEELQFTIKNNEEKHKKEVESLNIAHKEEVSNLNKAHKEELETKEQEYLNNVNSLNEEHAKKITTIREEHNNEISALNRRYQDEKEEFKLQFAEHIEQMEKENSEIKSREKELLDKIKYLEAQEFMSKVNSGQVKNNDFTSEEAFNALEELKEKIDNFYEEAWKETKKAIRKEVLSGKRKGKK